MSFSCVPNAVVTQLCGFLGGRDTARLMQTCTHLRVSAAPPYHGASRAGALRAGAPQRRLGIPAAARTVVALTAYNAHSTHSN
jgi:hypothetical protein